MAFLAWHERYSIGNAEIDSQHRKLFELVNHFDDVIEMGMTDELRQITEDLISSSVSHFRFEEGLMKDIAFPKLLDHQKMHGELINQLQEMRAKMTLGGHVSTKSIVRFLADWLTNHIMREDMDYKAYLNG